MRTYYRRHDALVTDDHFVWRTSPVKIFPIRELHGAGIVRHSSAATRATGVYLAGGSVALAAASMPLLDSYAAYVVVALVAVVPGVVGAACWRRRPQYWELHATFRGATVVVYASADPTAFNQVSRALLRALENAEPPIADRERRVAAPEPRPGSRGAAAVT